MTIDKKPILSIITPTLGKFSEYWLEELLKVKGEVEFIQVYPPNFNKKFVDDSRVKLITSPYKGEMMQRFVGLLNATGEYVLALDDDDFVHPEIVKLIVDYFQRFPESWILRLNKVNIDMKEEEQIKKDWQELPNISEKEITKAYEQGKFTGLLEVPIAPLDKEFKLQYFFQPFKKEGIFFENFNNIVWKNELVQKALPSLTNATKMTGALTWIPFSGFDRLLGLFIQAELFQKDAIIGHWMPQPEQIRYIDKDPNLKPPRFHVISDVLLVKQFPQYGYFWNLFFSKLYAVPRTIGKTVKWKYFKKK